MARNITKKLLCGIGINDASYDVTITVQENGKNKIVWFCPFYLKWKNMISRCYSERVQQDSPAYLNCSVHNDWLTFSNFKAWMEQQDWEGMELDKDILFPGNKIYSPDTCIFINSKINRFITDSLSARGIWPVGVTIRKDGKSFISRCADIVTGRREYLGDYSTPEAAHEAWRRYKLSQAKALSKEIQDLRIAKALIARYENSTY